jgi:anti-sigma factor RsiW
MSVMPLAPLLGGYLLDKMTEDERGIFEEHFFDCAECAADVTDGSRMMIAGRSVVEEESSVVPMPAPKPKQWLPAVAAASLVFTLLGGGAGYRLAMQRQQEKPTELVRVVRLQTGTLRSGLLAKIPVMRPGDDLRFDVEASDDAERYAAVVRCAGKTQSTHDISRAMAAESVTLRLGELPAGRCELVVQGVRKDGKRFGITTSPFEFQVGER